MDAIINILAIVLGITHVFVREVDELSIMHEVVEVCMVSAPANHDSTMVKAGGIGEEFPMLKAKILLSCCFLGYYYFSLQEACYIKAIFGDTIMDHFLFSKVVKPSDIPVADINHLFGGDSVVKSEGLGLSSFSVALPLGD
ncbi:hypothetical protein OIU85_022540, partial [Salix viminalis]